MSRFPSPPGARGEHLERTDSNTSDWSEIDDSELAEAIQWDQDQRLLHESREREAATMKAIRDMERVEFGGDSWSCPNCTLLNHSGSAQCEAVGVESNAI